MIIQKKRTAMFDYDDFDFQEFMEEEREIHKREEERRRKQNNE